MSTPASPAPSALLAFATRFDAPFTIVGPSALAAASEILAGRLQKSAHA